MPDEYISREAALTALQDSDLFNTTERQLRAIRELPAANVAEVVHGRWIDGAEDFTCGNHNAECSICRRIQMLIAYAPSVDAIPVVRCKDCKYYRNHPNGLCYLHTEPKENERGYSGEAVCVEPDDFCSYGERREE